MMSPLPVGHDKGWLIRRKRLVEIDNWSRDLRRCREEIAPVLVSARTSG